MNGNNLLSCSKLILSNNENQDTQIKLMLEGEKNRRSKELRNPSGLTTQEEEPSCFKLHHKSNEFRNPAGLTAQEEEPSCGKLYLENQ